METNDNENKMTQNLLDSINSPKREVHSNTCLPQDTREISNKNLTLNKKQLEKEQ